MSGHTLHAVKERPQEGEQDSDARKQEPDGQDQKPIRIESIRLTDRNGVEKNSFLTGEPAVLECRYEVRETDKEKVSIELVVLRNDGLECYETNTFREGIALMELEESGTIYCSIPKMNLITGEYWIEMAVRKPDAFPYDYKEKAFRFTVNSADRERGIAKLEHTWRFE